MEPSFAAFVDAFLLALSPGQLSWLRRRVEDGALVSKAELAACPALRPLLDEAEQGFVLPETLRGHILARLSHMSDGNGVVGGIAEALASKDDRVALSILYSHGGAFISMTQGLKVAQHVAEVFPEAMTQSNVSLGLLRTVNALKAGDLARADLLMEEATQRFNLPSLEACHSRHDPEVICVLFMKAVYDDASVPDAALEQLFAVLRDLPSDASLMRGLLYNVGLDVFMRRNEIAMADEAAQRALLHYDAAGETGLGFYIHLYLVIIALWQGDIGRAGVAVKAAEVALAMFSGHSTNDEALLETFRLIQLYEDGEPEGLVRHLAEQDSAVLFGELWPAMAEPILCYGRRALSTYATPAAALSWVQRWRLRQWRSRRFDMLISVQEAQALQALGRHQEADEVLARVEGGDNQELVLARIIAALDRAPTSDELALRIRREGSAPGHSERQRLMLHMLGAESAANRRNEREAVRRLGQAFTPPLGAQATAVLQEERGRLSRILESRSLRSELRRLPQLNACLQSAIDQATPTVPDGLTRQEYRVMLLLAEAQSNKMIAQRLGISLPTVKFHVGNLLKKAELKNRKALVQWGVAEGWLQERL